MNADGKKPIVQKKTQATAVAVSSYDDIFGNPLKISDELVKELAEKNLVGRFGDYKKLSEFGGYHPKGWVIYRRTPGDLKQASDFNATPDGIIRRGSCVLMVKSVEDNKKHRDYLDDKAANYGRAHKKQAADKMRQQAKQARMDTQIVDDYEWDGDK